MRNPFLRRLLRIVALVAAPVLLVGDLLVEPALAAPAHGPSASAAHQEQRAGVRRFRRRRLSRSSARWRRPAPAIDVAAFGGDVWAALRHCESTGRYDIATGNGYYGAYQFLPRTWASLGYPGLPHQAPREMQDEAARRLQARSGWGQWPACSRRLGLR